MPMTCAVLYCKSGSRTKQIKRFLLGVPKYRNIEIPNYMEEMGKRLGILGIVKLRQTDVICDKHFEEKDISREWIKLNANDQAIAGVSKIKKFHIGFKRVFLFKSCIFSLMVTYIYKKNVWVSMYVCICIYMCKCTNMSVSVRNVHKQVKNMLTCKNYRYWSIMLYQYRILDFKNRTDKSRFPLYWEHSIHQREIE
ncbi:hypothetical protein ACFW04_000223 [Cataglyphis niger]